MAPVIGVGRWVLHLPGCTSLKAKRRIVRGLRDRLQARFRVSAAETDFQDKWQRSVLAVVSVASQRHTVQKTLDRVCDELEGGSLAGMILRSQTDYVEGA